MLVPSQNNRADVYVRCNVIIKSAAQHNLLFLFFLSMCGRICVAIPFDGDDDVTGGQTYVISAGH